MRIYGGLDYSTFTKGNNYAFSTHNASFTNCHVVLSINLWAANWANRSGIGSLTDGQTVYLSGQSDVTSARITITVYADDQTKPFSFNMPAIQFETGSKPTPWALSPVDMATEAQYSSLSQTVSGLQTTVSNKLDTATYNSYVSQTATTIGTLLTKTDAVNTYETQSNFTQTVTSLQTSINAKVDNTTYNPEITQLSNDINLRVQVNDVINQINISTESILIAGQKVHITGQTTIDNAVIQSAMIAALDAGKITTGYLSIDRLAAKSVTVHKLNVVNLAAISADLGSVNAGTLTGVVINGATINQTSGANYISLSNSGFHAHEGIVDTYIDVNGFNLTVNGTNKFTVNAAGTVTLAGGAIQGATAVNLAIDSSAFISWGDGSQYSFGQGNDNGNLDVENNINLRTWWGFSVSPSISGALVPQYKPAFAVDARNGETYTKYNARVGRAIMPLTNTGSPPVGIFADGGVNVRNYVNSGWATVAASGFSQQSTENLKQDITLFTDSALAILNNTDIYSFRYIDEVTRGVAYTRYGIIIGTDYRVSTELLDGKQTGADLYNWNGINSKAIQELYQKYQEVIAKQASLELEIAQLKGAA